VHLVTHRLVNKISVSYLCDKIPLSIYECINFNFLLRMQQGYLAVLVHSALVALLCVILYCK
jgi:hypothetical protein